MAAVDERDRHELYEALESSIGAKSAGTMMTMLSNADWANLATKADVALVHTELHTEIGELRTDFGGLRTELKNDIDELRRERKSDMDSLRHELKEDANELRTELKGDMDGFKRDVSLHLDGFDERLRHQSRTVLFSMIGLMTAYTGIVLAAVHGAGPF